MSTISPKLRRYVYLAGGILVLYVLARLWAAIPTYDSKKLGEFAAAKVAYAKMSKQLLKENDSLTVRIAEKDKQLADKVATIGRKDVIVGGLNGKLVTLQAEYETLKDCPSRLVNLTLQVTNLEDTIKVKDGIISDKDDMIFTLTAQKGDYKKIADNYKAMLDAKIAEAEACDAVRKQVARDLKIKQLTGTVKTGIIIGAAGYLLYNALKKG